MTNGLFRLRWLFCGYALGCFILLVSGNPAMGLGVLVLSMVVHYCACTRKYKKIYTRQKKVFNERSHLRTIDFYLRDRRDVAMANPLPEAHRPWGERPIHEISPSHYLRKLTVREKIPRCSSPKLALDVGSLSGEISLEFVKKNYRMVLLDLDIVSLKHAIGITHCSGIIADMERLPFREDAFDFISMLEVIEHADRPLNVLKEIGRVCRRGGRLLITTDNRSALQFGELPNPMIVMSKIWSLFDDSVLKYRSILWMGDDGRRIYPHADFSWQEIRKMLHDAGYQIHTAASYDFLSGFEQLVSKFNRHITEGAYAGHALRIETVLRAIPFVNRLGGHWWLECSMQNKYGMNHEPVKFSIGPSEQAVP